VKDVPVPVSAIVSKLLAKTAEERYQTAAAWSATSGAALLHGKLSTESTPSRWANTTSPTGFDSEKLYGREREIGTLLAAFDASSPAVGRSWCWSPAIPASASPRSSMSCTRRCAAAPLFASGKFDQYKRDIPYATLAQAFQGLIRALLGKSDAELAGWRDALREALGPNGRLMIDVVPN